MVPPGACGAPSALTAPSHGQAGIFLFPKPPGLCLKAIPPSPAHPWCCFTALGSCLKDLLLLWFLAAGFIVLISLKHSVCSSSTAPPCVNNTVIHHSKRSHPGVRELEPLTKAIHTHGSCTSQTDLLVGMKNSECLIIFLLELFSRTPQKEFPPPPCFSSGCFLGSPRPRVSG